MMSIHPGSQQAVCVWSEAIPLGNEFSIHSGNWQAHAGGGLAVPLPAFA